jgi:hypothetical protein
MTTTNSLFNFPAPGDRVRRFPSGLGYAGTVIRRATTIAVVRHDNGVTESYRPEELHRAGPRATILSPLDASISVRVRDGLVPLREGFKAMLTRRMDRDGTEAITVPVMNGSSRSGEVTYTRADLA